MLIRIEQRITSDVKIEVLEMRVTKTWSVSIWMKATELQYFPRVVRLFIIMYKVFLTFESVEEILPSVTIQIEATEQHFPVCLLFCTRRFYLLIL